MMQDEKGVYYFPEPGNSKIRVYARKNGDEIEFRLWASDNGEVWEKHQWIPYSVIEQAAELYKRERNANVNPIRLYDISVARALLKGKKD